MERWPLCSNTTVLQNSTLLHDQTHGEIQEFFWHRVGNRVRGFETKWLFLVSAKPIKRTRPYLRMTRWSGCECTDHLQRSPQMNCLSEPQTVDAWSTLLSLFDSICRTRVGSDWCSRDYNLQPLLPPLLSWSVLTCDCEVFGSGSDDDKSHCALKL